MLEGEFETVETIAKDITESLTKAKLDWNNGFKHAAIKRLTDVQEWCKHLEAYSAKMVVGVISEITK